MGGSSQIKFCMSSELYRLVLTKPSTSKSRSHPLRLEKVEVLLPPQPD